MGERREQKQRAEFRQQLHARFDHWLDSLEEQVKEPKPTLEQLTRAGGALRQELTGGLTEAWGPHRYGAAQAQRTAPGPQCGQPVGARAGGSRRVETWGGSLALNRP